MPPSPLRPRIPTLSAPNDTPGLRLGLLTLVAVALALSAWQPADRLTWFMEVAPVFIAAPLLMATHRRFPLTPLLCVLIAVHALVLILGGAYTYAKVPLGFWLQDWLGTQRNPYDKVGHFMQGLVPALVAREVLRRRTPLAAGPLLGFLCLCVAMAISAWYELIEWGAAVALGQGADEFLGTQGDPFDTQSDMGFACLGALVTVLLLAPWHERQLAPWLRPVPASGSGPTGPAGRPARRARRARGA